MGFEDVAPFLGVLGLSFALSCVSTVCWCRQRAQVEQFQQRLVSVEQRPLQQIQLLAHDTGYGQAYHQVPTVPPSPPTYYAPPAPSAPYYGTNVV